MFGATSELKLEEHKSNTRTLELETVQPPISFKECETDKIKRDYLHQLMTNEVAKMGESFRTDFLNKHRISAEVRVRMVGLLFTVFGCKGLALKDLIGGRTRGGVGGMKGGSLFGKFCGLLKRCVS